MRLRFRRSICAGPLSIVTVATFARRTGPFLPGTVRRSMAARSARTLLGSLTRIGTCRSGRFIFVRSVS
ncbi:hypothetical protein D3C72_1388540 [compost metagenome]